MGDRKAGKRGGIEQFEIPRKQEEVEIVRADHNEGVAIGTAAVSKKNGRLEKQMTSMVLESSA